MPDILAARWVRCGALGPLADGVAAQRMDLCAVIPVPGTRFPELDLSTWR